MTIKELFNNEEHSFNALYSLGYVILLFVLAGLVWLVDEEFPRSISTFDFILLSLATFRLVRLFVYDEVTLFLREYLASHTKGPLNIASHLFSCPWCFGVWAGTLVAFFYFVMPMAWFVVLILAIAGVGSFVQILINQIGWRAEQLKGEVSDK